jgi:hypothetical protein
VGFLSEFSNLGFSSSEILSAGFLSAGFLSCEGFVGNPNTQLRIYFRHGGKRGYGYRVAGMGTG